MLHIPLWKKIVIWGVVATGLLLAMPNLFYGQVEDANDARAAIEAEGATPELRDAANDWPGWLPSSLVNLGLDLRGGAHLLAEVEVEDVYASRMDGLWPQLRDTLRGARDEVGTFRRVGETSDTLTVQLGDPSGMGRAMEIARSFASPVSSLTGVGAQDLAVSGDGDRLIITLSEEERAAIEDQTLQQTLEIVRRRVDEVGTREPTIQRQGARRVLIQVPGIGSAAELRELIGTTAQLTFSPVVSRGAGPDTVAGPDEVVLPSLDTPDISYVIERNPVVTGEQLTDAQPSFDQNGQPAVTFRFNPTGARAFGDYTAANIGSPFAIVLDDEVVSAPVIQSHIPGGNGIITGNFTIEDSTQLAVLLRAGALPAELTFLEERTIGPELGQDSIDAGRTACIVAFIAVMAVMWASYGLFGFFANIALLVNVGLIFGLLSLVGATLTLPGIAGIVLTIGMAVDANVLVFERIREELKTARGPSRAIQLGYEKALSAIVDANITTFIIATILFTLGSGPVRGFAVTLGLGIMTSVFTALFVTRVIVVMWFERRRPKTIEV